MSFQFRTELWIWCWGGISVSYASLPVSFFNSPFLRYVKAISKFGRGVKVNISPSSPWRYKGLRGIDPHFLTPAINNVEWSTSWLAALSLDRERHCALNSRLGGLRPFCSFWRREKSLVSARRRGGYSCYSHTSLNDVLRNASLGDFVVVRTS